MSDSEPHPDLSEEEGDDLFGDEDNEIAGSDEGAAQSDKELASDPGDDEPQPRDDDEADEEPQVRDKVIMGIQMSRHRIPGGKDAAVQTLRVPKFLKFLPEEYDPKEWQPTEFDMANARDPNPVSTIRFRRDPTTGALRSNTMVYKWNDGSMTISVGGEQFQMRSKAQVPPADRDYDETKDAHQYAAAAHLGSNLLMVVGHVTEQYDVRPTKAVQDDALDRLAEKIQAAQRGNTNDNIIRTTQDPELMKRQAELAEKERAKAQRRRETAAARMDGMGRYRSGAGGGLSVGDLEGAGAGGAGGRRAPGSGARKRGAPGSRPKRRRPEYDSDDDLPSGARRQEDYDLEDAFIAPSDEEISVEDDEDDEEELLDDDDDEAPPPPRSKRQKTAEADDADADADGEADDDVPAAVADQGRSRRRNVIADDDD